MKRIFRSGEQTKEITLTHKDNQAEATIEGASFLLGVERLSDTEILLWRGEKPVRVALAKGKPGETFLTRGGVSHLLRVEESGRKRAQHTESALSSPMPGKVIRVLKAAGETVLKGESIVVVEAMKMELPIKAPREGVIKAIQCQPGEKVAAGVTLVELE